MSLSEKCLGNQKGVFPSSQVFIIVFPKFSKYDFLLFWQGKNIITPSLFLFISWILTSYIYSRVANSSLVVSPHITTFFLRIPTLQKHNPSFIRLQHSPKGKFHFSFLLLYCLLIWNNLGVNGIWNMRVWIINFGW